MAHYRVQGGKPLSGRVEVTSGKNAPVALICGALAIRGKTVLKNMTPVEEVKRLVELLESIGACASWLDASTLEIDASGPLHMENIDRALCGKMRITLLLMGALAAREKRFNIYKSAGCKLGNRTIRPHVFALEKLGIRVESTDTHYAVDAPTLQAADIVMYESGDTATENAILGAVLAPGTTIIRFASANYMVQDLCYFLIAAGAQIEGIGTTTLTITGVDALDPIEYAAMPDPVDAMAWISLGVTTKSPLTVVGCAYDFIALELEHLWHMNANIRMSPKYRSESGHFDLVDLDIVPSDLVALPDKLTCRPYPGLNIDALPLFTPICTQAEGQSLIHDWVYENRAIYALELQKLGANVLLMDTHRVLIQGLTPLVGAEVVAPNAIRPAMSVLICMLAAQGESVLRNAYPVDRAYHGLVDRLTAIGAAIALEE